MNTSHDSVVQRQFGPQAQAYVESSVHAAGADLDWIEEYVSQLSPARALDLGCGGGHVAYRLARHAGRVIACDLSADMVGAVLETAADKGLPNIEGQVASAADLPFADNTFDCVICRFSAHHWRDFMGGLTETRRVLRQGGIALFIDVAAPENALADTHLQAIELLRDPSHVRDYRLSEWSSALAFAGFELKSLRSWKLRMDFEPWIARMRTSDTHVAAIRSLQEAAAEELCQYFAIEQDGSFVLDTTGIEAI